MDQRKMGKTISFLRKRFNMTQQQLADQLGVSDKTISKWENGHGAPDISVLSKLSVSLDIDIESLLEGHLIYFDLKWKGVLILDYPANVRPYMMLGTLPIVEFQLSLMMLAGISHIMVMGDEHEIRFVQDILHMDECGIRIEYEYVNVHEMESVNPILEKVNSEYGIMMIHGPDFIYGKDLTKLLKRVICDSTKPVILETCQHLPLSVYMYPHKTYQTGNFEKLTLERGIVAFQIQSQEDLWDASGLIHIIERHMGEKIGCLKDIAERRGYVEKGIERSPDGRVQNDKFYEIMN